ncbi:MAG: extracellular solute-binding protein [Lachnospiraceae bacterium]|jgi:ABC-type glycerol-3-phosphate transport system substrate-binding protein|nr:extracellular solute-binding protein [Lachnospiraceae bacterium]
MRSIWNKKRIHGKFHRPTAIILAGICIATAGYLTPPVVGSAQTQQSPKDYETITDSYNFAVGYREYVQQTDPTRPDDVYVIHADTYVRTQDMEIGEYKDYEGEEGTSVYTGSSGLIEYEVTIKTAGRYDMSIRYYPVKGNGSSIQRSFFIDGELPYSELNSIEFSRVWKNVNSEWNKDNQGNDLRPEQIEAPEWMDSYLYDSEGYVSSRLSVYLTEGKHTITIVSQREPMLLRSITLSNPKDPGAYEEVKASWDALGGADTSGQLIVIEAEGAAKKSTQMLYPIQDQSTPAVTPYSAKCLLNNTIGGTNWQNTGKWIEWNFDTPESGYYDMSMYVKQNFIQGIPVNRKITIDGKVPFEEFHAYPFNYDGDWRMDTLTDKDGEPYKVYLNKGTHTIRMEVVLGEFSKIIDRVEDVIKKLNAIYRKVIRITGVAPDGYRDYELSSTLPGTGDELAELSRELTSIIDELNGMAGVSGESERVLITMRDQLDELSGDPERFSKVLDSYKTNISALGTWVGNVSVQPLQIDRIFIYSPDYETPEVRDGFFQKLLHEIKRLYYSFLIDYNVIGNVSDKKESQTVTVWIGSGRDQANTLKSLTDKRFTYETGINVNVMLVDMGTLLQATLAGEGPDVAIGVSGEIPMNFGLRNAAENLSGFEGFPNLYDDFFESAWDPYVYDQKVYGLPETLSFPMMFYRKDILAELGIVPPKTWDEVKVDLSVLSNNQMDLGMLPTEAVFATLLYQNSGQYYRDDKKASNLASETAIGAFKNFCEYYTKYTLDRETSLTNQFRTGEAPIIIADYTTYCELIASAPDIKGLWGFTRVPGTVREDGSIDHTTASGGTAAIMMSGCQDKDAAWQFMRWWVGADTQSAYGLELEGIMGEAARYPTANKEAFASLPWLVSEYNALYGQMENLKGIPQVPGGYFSWRNVRNAFYKTVISKTMEPREALTEYVRYINEEINYKRKEFNLPVMDE